MQEVKGSVKLARSSLYLCCCYPSGGFSTLSSSCFAVSGENSEK